MFGGDIKSLVGSFMEAIGQKLDCRSYRGEVKRLVGPSQGIGQEPFCTCQELGQKSGRAISRG
jgi:hypothetical protein